jgi:hypothetical protein
MLCACAVISVAVAAAALEAGGREPSGESVERDER